VHVKQHAPYLDLLAGKYTGHIKDRSARHVRSDERVHNLIRRAALRPFLYQALNPLQVLYALVGMHAPRIVMRSGRSMAMQNRRQTGSPPTAYNRTTL
jgi:hypothetical protein